jgi:hypothetical protein
VLEGPVRGDPHSWQNRAGVVEGEAMEMRIAAATWKLTAGAALQVSV